MTRRVTSQRLGKPARRGASRGRAALTLPALRLAHLADTPAARWQVLLKLLGWDEV